MKNRAFAMIIVAGILWGTSGIFVYYLAPFGFSSLHMTFLRALVSAVSLAGYICVHDKCLFKVTPKELLLFACGGLSFFGTAGCYYMSMQVTSVSTAVVLMYTAPVLVMIFSVLFWGERLTPLKAAAIFAMLLGCFLVSGVIGGMRFDLWGIFLGIMSGLSYSVYNIVTKMQMRNGSNPISATFYCFASAALIGLFVSGVQEIPGIIGTRPVLLLFLIAGLGICTCVLPYFLYTLAMKVLPAGTATALGIIEPMAATVFSVVLFKDQMGIFSLIGIILILGATFMLNKDKEID